MQNFDKHKMRVSSLDLIYDRTGTFLLQVCVNHFEYWFHVKFFHLTTASQIKSCPAVEIFQIWTRENYHIFIPVNREINGKIFDHRILRNWRNQSRPWKPSCITKNPIYTWVCRVLKKTWNCFKGQTKTTPTSSLKINAYKTVYVVYTWQYDLFFYLSIFYLF